MGTAVAVRTAVQAQAAAPVRSMTMQELSAYWVAYVDASPKTVQSYTRSIRQFMKWLAEEKITSPSRQDLMRYRDSLKARLSPATVQAYMAAVRLFFRWLADEAHLYPNIAEGLKGAKIDHAHHKKDYLTAAQVKTLLSSVGSSRDKAMLALMVACGLRTVEISRLSVMDLTVAAGHCVVLVQGKGKEERTPVKVPAQVEALLRQYLATRRPEEATGEAPLFLAESNRSGGRLTTRSISRIVKRHFIAIGLNSDRLTAHSTRHTAITLALMAGKGLEEVQHFARHASLSTTMIYAHDLDDAANTCAEAVAGQIF